MLRPGCRVTKTIAHPHRRWCKPVKNLSTLLKLSFMSMRPVLMYLPICSVTEELSGIFTGTDSPGPLHSALSNTYILGTRIAMYSAERFYQKGADMTKRLGPIF